MISKHAFVDNISNEPELFLFYTVEWFQVLPDNGHNLTSVIC